MSKGRVSTEGGRIWSPLLIGRGIFLLVIGLSMTTARSNDAGLPVHRASPHELQGRVPSVQDEMPRGRHFPGLLIARGRHSSPSFHTPGVVADDAYGRVRAESGGRERFEGLGNAYWDPDGVLRPSVLPRSWRDRTNALLAAPDGAARRELLLEYSHAKSEHAVVRILALRVDFLEDSPGHRTTGNGRFDLRRDEEARSIPIDPPPHDRNYFESHFEAVSRYYDVMSGGRLRVEFDVFPAENDSAYHLQDTALYGPWIFSNSNPDVLQHAINLVGDALAVADTTDPTIDWSRYNSFAVIHAGSDFQSDVNRDSPWDIPSFNLFVADPFMVQDGEVPVNLVMVLPETVSQDGFLGAMNGVYAHEFGHQVGFHDLYDVRNGLSVVGAFSLMDSGDNLYGFVEDPREPGRVMAVRGMLPASLDPWHKLYLLYPQGYTDLELPSPDDFLDADSTSFTVELPAVAVSNRILTVPLSLAEEFLLENRRYDLNGDSLIILRADPETGVILGPEPDSSAVGDTLAHREYDYLLPGEGVVVWHVDWKAVYAGLRTPFGGVNIDFGRPGVRVVEADGIRDIGTASAEYLGGLFDPYYAGGYSYLGPETRPNTNTNDGTPTGIEITVLDSPALNMRVQVDMGRSPSGWPLAYVGLAGQEQSLVLDLEGDGLPEFLTVAGSEVFVWKLDASAPYGDPGCPACFLQSPLPAPIRFGLAGRDDFLCIEGECGAGHEGVLLAFVSGGSLYMVDDNGMELAIWPSGPPCDPDLSTVTSTPVVLSGMVLAGCADGKVRAFVPDAIDPLRGELDACRGAVTALGAGYSADGGGEGSLVIFFASDEGEMGALVWDGDHGSAPNTLFNSSRPQAAVPRSILAASPDPSAGPRFMYLWEDGRIDWVETDGASLPGWPSWMPAPPAGAAIICDVGDDGSLETLVADETGVLHCLTWSGTQKHLWPRRLWSEDVQSPPLQTLGPLAMDVTGDGVPEILIHRADGQLLAMDGRGQSVPGWPYSAGYLARNGPYLVPGSGGWAARLAVGNAQGYTADDRPITAVSMIRVPGMAGWTGGAGSYPVAGVDPGRSRFYPGEWVPEFRGVEGGFLSESLRIYPNPVLGDAVTVRFVLGEPARVILDAYDLSGRSVAMLEATGRAGADGNHIRWDLSGLAPGLYHVRFRAMGDGIQEDSFHKLAIVR